MNLELEQLKMKLAELEQALLATDPQMPLFLKQVHSTLLQYPELVHILQPEERAIVISGLKVMANTDVIAPIAQKSARSAIKKKEFSLDDI